MVLVRFIESNSKYGKAQWNDALLAKEFNKQHPELSVSAFAVRNTRDGIGIKPSRCQKGRSEAGSNLDSEKILDVLGKMNDLLLHIAKRMKAV
jgi:hypothetical protein